MELVGQGVAVMQVRTRNSCCVLGGSLALIDALLLLPHVYVAALYCVLVRCCLGKSRMGWGEGGIILQPHLPHKGVFVSTGASSQGVIPGLADVRRVASVLRHYDP